MLWPPFRVELERVELWHPVLRMARGAERLLVGRRAFALQGSLHHQMAFSLSALDDKLRLRAAKFFARRTWSIEGTFTTTSAEGIEDRHTC